MQEFDLQILQKNKETEETPVDTHEIAPPKEVSSIYIPIGTTLPKIKFSNSLCNGFRDILQPTLFKEKNNKVIQIG